MQRKKRNKSLNFITDIAIRNKIQVAIETSSFLFLMERDNKFDTGTSKEVRRIIILYAASIIEAILLYLYKKGKFSIEKVHYSDVYTLPSVYQLDSKSTLIVAKQFKKERHEREIMLDVLVELFFDKKIIGKSLKLKIDTARNIRNTFHLSKSRKGISCNIGIVNIANDAVLGAILVVTKYLSRNP